MNEIQTNNFDYSVLDSSTAEYLKDRENSMSKTLENAAEKLGEDLTKAKEKLSKKGYGCFEDWYTSLGLKTTSVYRYINRYEFVSSKLEDSKMLETFQELTPSLQNEMSKPSANPEINQKVFDGDIKTHKEYKELEKKYKEQQERLEKAESMTESTKNWFHDVSNKLKKRDEENKILQSKLEEMESQEPDVIERYTDPEDYQETKNMNKHLLKENEYYKNLTENLKNEMNNFNKAEEPIRNTPQDQTEIIIEMLRNIENFINDDSYSFDIKKIKSVANNIFEGME